MKRPKARLPERDLLAVVESALQISWAKVFNHPRHRQIPTRIAVEKSFSTAHLVRKNRRSEQGMSEMPCFVGVRFLGLHHTNGLERNRSFK